MVVTGTSRGIGRGVTEHFLARGYRVAGCSRGLATLTADGYQHAQVDVGDEEAVRAWIKSVRRTWGHIDVLVSSAALAPANLLMMTTSGAVLEELLRTNIAGTYYVCREAAATMTLQRAGRIITMSSMAAALLDEGTSAYAASKSAVVTMTKVLAKELAPLGITCNTIAPSMVETGALEALGEAVVARARERLTLKRTVSIEEICHLVAFLAAPESACITGQVIHMGLVS